MKHKKLSTIKLTKQITKEEVLIDIYIYKTGYRYDIHDNKNNRHYKCNDSTKEVKLINKLIDKQFKEENE